MGLYACIDIGGSAIKHALADEMGNLLEKGSVPSGLPEGGTANMLDKVARIIEGYQKDHDVKGAAIDTAGIVDPESGAILMSGRNFPGYAGTNVKRFIEERCKVPCEVENDVNCAALGEAWLGAGQGVKNLVCIAVGTGIGSGIILGGRLLHGANFGAGEVGYMHTTDRFSDYERSANVPFLIQTYAELSGTDPKAADGRKIFDLAEKGDKAAAEAIGRFVHNLCLGLANICCVLNPELILLGGGIMARRDYLRPLLQKEMEGAASEAIRGKTRFDFASLGNDAGMIGALRNFLDRNR